MAGFKKRSRDDTEDEPRKIKAVGKKQKNASTAAAAVKDDTPTWELGNKRRLTISKFNNRVLVNIREYYEKDGEMLPGKKGISLTTEQWETILGDIPAINGSLRAQGVILKGDNMAASDEDAMDTDSDDKPLQKSKPKTKAKSKAKGAEKEAVSTSASQKKANIEATSDEEENDDDTEESDYES